ncbi:hypothetical protein FBR02_05970 [Anaerolineae bacterium CFX9]|nr:hypothetical protein [Anaerolineae bacterium CFX9]
MRSVRADFWALISLRWRQFRDDARYWLRVLGYQSNDDSFSQKMYVFYLAIIGLIWLYTVGGWVLERAGDLGAVIAPVDAGNLLILLSYVPLIGFVLALSAALRTTPLKLTFPDIAYVAGSPIVRAAPVLVGFVRYVVFRAALIGVAVILFTVMLNRALYGRVTVEDVLRALSVWLALAVVTYAAAWAAGVARLSFPKLRTARLLWLTPFALLPLAFVLPDAALWSGRAAVLALVGEAPGWVIVVLVGMGVILLVGLGVLSRRMDMIQAADESQLYARLQAIGLLQYIQPRTQARIRAQAARARRKVRWRLPEATGWNGLVSRALLSYARHPLSLIMAAVWGAVMTWAAASVILNQLPAQLWIGLAIIAGIRPPGGLLYVFEQDVEEPFLRQFLPFSTIGLMAADALLPFLILLTSSSIVWFVIAPSLADLLMGMIVIVVTAGLLLFCGAFGATRQRRFESRFFATLIALVAAMIIGNGLQSPLAGIITMLLAIMLIGGWISSEG